MRIVGDLQKYTLFQAADSLQTAAANPGGIAGAGVGMGAGLAMGQIMAQAMGGTSSAPTQAAPVEDPILMIEKLGELFKKGMLTQAEFDQKKTELLGRIK